MSRETDYAVLLLAHLARNDDLLLSSARELAQETHLPLPTTSKLLKVLARAGVLISQRGPHGGYTLARNPEQINIVEVIGAIEGPVALTECVDRPGYCWHESLCQVRENWQTINSRVIDALRQISLAEMARPTNQQLVSLDAEPTPHL